MPLSNQFSLSPVNHIRSDISKCGDLAHCSESFRLHVVVVSAPLKMGFSCFSEILDGYGLPYRPEYIFYINLHNISVQNCNIMALKFPLDQVSVDGNQSFDS